jgi:hypothetical protein
MSSLGCYEYAPATLEVVPVGARVRAQLSSEAELALRDSLGMDMRVLDGTLVDRAEGRLLLQVRTQSGARAFGDQALYQRIGVAPPDVLRLDIRRVNRLKTVGLVAAIAGAATVVAIKVFARRRPGTPDPGGKPPPE